MISVTRAPLFELTSGGDPVAVLFPVVVRRGGHLGDATDPLYRGPVGPVMPILSWPDLAWHSEEAGAPAQLPLKFASLFSMKAVTPSTASSEANDSWNAS